MIISSPTVFRRTVRGASMIAAPLVFVIAEVLHARFEEDPEDFLSALAQDTGRWYAAHVLVLGASSSHCRPSWESDTSSRFGGLRSPAWRRSHSCPE